MASLASNKMRLRIAGSSFSPHLFDEIEFQTGRAEFVLSTYQYDAARGCVFFTIERRPFKELKRRFLGIVESATYEADRVRTIVEIGRVTKAEFQRADWAPKDDRFLIERGIAVRRDHVSIDSLMEDAGRKAFRLIVNVAAIDIRLDDATQ